MDDIDEAENESRMLRGELYYAFTPSLTAKRKRYHFACHRFNTFRFTETGEASRRKLVELWREYVFVVSKASSNYRQIAASLTTSPHFHPQQPRKKKTPFFSKTNHLSMDPSRSITASTSSISSSLLITSHPLTRYRLGKGVQINYDSTFIDTCPIIIGARTLIGPNCSFYSGTHPLDPFLRNGMEGPELGARIDIGEDCWFGGNVVVCPGVKIGRGVTVGAGSVVTRDVDDFCVVAGNPARVLRRLEVNEKDLKFAGDV
jgi:acetyltransferase-like isoleucine patch superfamily enzyme